jgi:hypothetical protein
MFLVYRRSSNCDVNFVSEYDFLFSRNEMFVSFKKKTIFKLK